MTLAIKTSFAKGPFEILDRVRACILEYFGAQSIARISILNYYIFKGGKTYTHYRCRLMAFLGEGRVLAK